MIISVILYWFFTTFLALDPSIGGSGYKYSIVIHIVGGGGWGLDFGYG